MNKHNSNIIGDSMPFEPVAIEMLNNLLEDQTPESLTEILEERPYLALSIYLVEKNLEKDVQELHKKLPEYEEERLVNMAVANMAYDVIQTLAD